MQKFFCCPYVAFNAPLLPILLLQLKFDQKIDVRFGSLVCKTLLLSSLVHLRNTLGDDRDYFFMQQTFRLRIFITMMVCSGILYVLPWLDKSLAVFIWYGASKNNATTFVTDPYYYTLNSLVALLGIFNGIGTGAYFALVSVFPIKTPVCAQPCLKFFLLISPIILVDFLVSGSTAVHRHDFSSPVFCDATQVSSAK